MHYLLLEWDFMLYKGRIIHRLKVEITRLFTHKFTIQLSVYHDLLDTLLQNHLQAALHISNMQLINFLFVTAMTITSVNAGVSDLFRFGQL